MTVRDEALRAAVLGALKDLIDGEYQHARGQTLEGLLTVRRETGTKSIEVALPNGQTVAGITLMGGEGQVVVNDRPEFVKWVFGRSPAAVSQEQSPRARVAMALRSELPELNSAAAINAAQAVLTTLGIDSKVPDPKVDPKYETQILDEVKPVEAEGDEAERPVVLPDTGEIVPGVVYQPPSDPTKFQLRYKKGGRDAIAAAWRAHQLDGIEGLPEVES